MLQVARLSPNLLQEAADPVAEYLRSAVHRRWRCDGSSRSERSLLHSVRAGRADRATTRAAPRRTASFLTGFGNGEGLDLVHLCCLARCWAALKQTPPDLADQISAAWDRDSVYHSFLAWGALQDLGQTPTPFPVGGVSPSPAKTTPTTAAAVTLRRQMETPVPPDDICVAAGAGSSGGRLRGD